MNLFVMFDKGWWQSQPPRTDAVRGLFDEAVDLLIRQYLSMDRTAAPFLDHRHCDHPLTVDDSRWLVLSRSTDSDCFIYDQRWVRLIVPVKCPCGKRFPDLAVLSRWKDGTDLSPADRVPIQCFRTGRKWLNTWYWVGEQNVIDGPIRGVVEWQEPQRPEEQR